MKTPASIQLRKTILSDLDHFFTFQLDAEANHLAAFTAKDPADKEAYINKYSKFVDDPAINFQTIIVDNKIAGSISRFVMFGDAGITYWIDKKFWNKGIATAALQHFLTIEPARPIFGHTAFDNFASQKVLEKCGFKKVGTDKGFANARQTEIEEMIFKLE